MSGPILDAFVTPHRRASVSCINKEPNQVEQSSDYDGHSQLSILEVCFSPRHTEQVGSKRDRQAGEIGSEEHHEDRADNIRESQ